MNEKGEQQEPKKKKRSPLHTTDDEPYIEKDFGGIIHPFTAAG